MATVVQGVTQEINCGERTWYLDIVSCSQMSSFISVDIRVSPSKDF